MKIQEPKIDRYENASLEDYRDEETIYNCLFDGNLDEEISFDYVIFDSCIFKNFDFGKIDAKGIEFVDVILENCDLSGKSFTSRLLNRVNFKNCKLLGTSFIDSSLRDVQFIDCVAKYVNFAGSRPSNLLICNSDFSETTFLENKFINTSFEKVNFSKSEISKCNLDGIDFSSCNLDEIVLDLESMQGMIIDRFQAIDIIRLLGVKFKD